MGTQKEHISKSNDDEQFALSLDRAIPVQACWIVTILFYAALHQVQAYFARMGQNPTMHTARDSAIQRDAKLKIIYIDYREMETYSRTARYDTVPILAIHVKSAEGCLDRIKKTIAPLL